MKGYISESSQALLLKGAFLYWRIDNRARIKTLAKNVKTAENPPEPTDAEEYSLHSKINKKERILKRFSRPSCFFCRIIKNYRARWSFKVFKYWFIPWLILTKLLRFCKTTAGTHSLKSDTPLFEQTPTYHKRASTCFKLADTYSGGKIYLLFLNLVCKINLDEYLVWNRSPSILKRVPFSLKGEFLWWNLHLPLLIRGPPVSFRWTSFWIRQVLVSKQTGTCF